MESVQIEIPSSKPAALVTADPPTPHRSTDGTNTGTTSATLVGTPVDPPDGATATINKENSSSQHRLVNQTPHQLKHSHQTLPLPESSKSNLSRLLSGSGSCLLSSSGGATPEDRLNARLTEGKMVTPRRHPRTNLKGLTLESLSAKRSRLLATRHSVDVSASLMKKERPCDEHCFLADVADVRQMEQGLLQLLDNFHSGKLQAFGQDCTLEKMEQVREQQDRLARLHFDLNTRQELIGPQSNEGRQIAKDNLPKLIDNLQQLSLSIEQLQSASPGVQTDV